jgi:prepilin-type N-terminal cleavage/methylation domain-containing protein
MRTTSKNQVAGQRTAQRAFTLIELLIVISIIAVLAAFTIPVMTSVLKSQKITVAKAELSYLETALESYKAKYGAYPPSNTNNPAASPLYYELSGVTNIGSSYQTLDGYATFPVASYPGEFGVGGVINSSKGSGEDAVLAKNFLPSLKATQLGGQTNSNSGNVNVYFLVTSVGGPDPITATSGAIPGLGAVSGGYANPIRYNSANPTNNPNSYDLWVDLVINGKTNRVSNWSQNPQVIQ